MVGRWCCEAGGSRAPPQPRTEAAPPGLSPDLDSPRSLCDPAPRLTQPAPPRPAHLRAPRAPGPDRYTPARPRPHAVRSGSRSRIPTGRAPRPAAQACPAPPPAGRGLSVSPPQPQPACRPPRPALPQQPRPLALRMPGPRRAQTHADSGSLPEGMRDPTGEVRRGGAGAWTGKRGLSGRKARARQRNRRDLVGGKDWSPTEEGRGGAC